MNFNNLVASAKATATATKGASREGRAFLASLLECSTLAHRASGENIEQYGRTPQEVGGEGRTVRKGLREAQLIAPADALVFTTKASHHRTATGGNIAAAKANKRYYVVAANIATEWAKNGVIDAVREMAIDFAYQGHIKEGTRPDLALARSK